MEEVKKEAEAPGAAGGAAAVVAVTAAEAEAAAVPPAAPKVILHSVDRGKTCPSISPFVLKLETYLRMADIPYEFQTKKPFGPKGKTPWIEYDGTAMGDSELIIQFLNKKFEKELWGHADKADKAVAQSMRIMLEDHLLCGLAEWRWVTGLSSLSEIMDGSGIKLWLIKTMVSRKVKSALNTQGIGLHTPEERFQLLRQDLEAVADYLGTKDYLLGYQPTQIDATVFGVLAQFVWAAPGSQFNRVITEEFPTLIAYVNRMKDKFWADWDSLITKKPV